LPNVKGNIACRVVIELDKTEKYLASISKSLEVIAEELKKRNEPSRPVTGQSSKSRETKHKLTK
jgi:hypothetical protein